MTLAERVTEAIEASDHDELLRVVDALSARRSWDGLVDLRRRCREAVGRGKQLWGVEEHIRYRLALEAPGSWAGAVVSEGPARFALGPLPEVAASRHPWAELEPHLAPTPQRAYTAHERVLRGEDLRHAEVDPHVLELPLALEAWEPRYATAEYHSDRAEFPTPEAPRLEVLDLPAPGPRVADPEAIDALHALVETWVDQSNGRAEAVAVEGSAPSALRALGVARAAVAEIGLSLALDWMAWAGASGGAYGRRPGGAAGRHAAWWAAAALAGLDWPPEPAALGEEATRLRWFLWSDGVTSGWVLRLAVEAPDEGLAWAMVAVDERNA